MMLKFLKDMFNSMGDSMKFAHAGEMLSAEQKNGVLSQREGAYPVSANASLPRVVLASDENFGLESVERAISLCHEEHAILDLLCVSQEGANTSLNLSAVLPLLSSDASLDFQVTRRQGNFLPVVDNYLRSHRDTMMVMININEHIRDAVLKYQRKRRWPRSEKSPAVELVDQVVHG